ncbi:unnamed protein product [Ilex paraguariensis]|uniref:Uncharacterized protein n=1 Tax=Ilex paraguariensis TaxID=185542 RepID=A0ABC8SLP8_9AQUA
MTVYIEGERTRGGRRRHNTARISVFLLCVILIFIQLCPSCAQQDNIGRSIRLAPARKSQFFHTVSIPAASPTKFSGTDDKDSDKLYGDDKRRVHTGPNPLHN